MSLICTPSCRPAPPPPPVRLGTNHGPPSTCTANRKRTLFAGSSSGCVAGPVAIVGPCAGCAAAGAGVAVEGAGAGVAVVGAGAGVVEPGGVGGGVLLGVCARASAD